MLKTFQQLKGSSRRDVLVAFSTLCVLLAGHTMLETSRDALFLAKLPAEQLPFAYLAMACAVAVTTRLNVIACRRFPPRLVLTVTLLCGSALTAAFWVLTANGPERLLFALYVWPGLLTTTALVQLWLRLHDALDVERAKDLYAAIGAGGTLGAFIGSAAASALAEVVSSRGLLLGSATLLACAGILPLLLSSPHNQPILSTDRAREFPTSRSSQLNSTRLTDLLRDEYGRNLVLVMFAMSVCTTLVDFLFKWKVATTVASEDLASFFARFYTLVNIVALVAQIFLVPWLLRRSDVHRAVLVLPCLLALCGLGLAIMPILAMTLVLRGVDGIFRFSLFGTASEIFYLPLRGAVRDRLKGLVAAAGQRGGQAVASLAILAVHGLAAGPRTLSITLLAAASTACGLVVTLRRGYVSRFHARLRERVLDPRIDAPPLDVESLESLLTSLSAADEDEVLAALDLLHMYDKDRVVPPLILHHPSEAVVLRALDHYAIARRDEVKPLLEVLLRRPEPRIRAAALRTACAYDEEVAQRALAACAGDDDPVVAVTRALAALRFETASPPRSPAMQLPEARSEEERLALARGIALLPLELQARAALLLIKSGEDAVRVELARALVRAPSAAHFDVLIQLLGHPSTRELARRAFLALGEDAVLHRLERRLSDRNLHPSIRLHVPRTISRFRSPRASRFLSRWLVLEHDERVAFKILRGLGRMRADRQRLPVDVNALRAVAMQTLERGVALLRARTLIAAAAAAEITEVSTPGARLCLALLDERLERVIERVFRVLHIVSPRADFHIIHASCYDEDVRVRAAARELLGHLLPRSLRVPILGLLRGEPPSTAIVPTAQQLEAALSLGAKEDIERAYRPFIESLTRDADLALAAVARSHLGELHTSENGEAGPELLEGVMERLAIHARHRASRTSVTSGAP